MSPKYKVPTPWWIWNIFWILALLGSVSNGDNFSILMASLLLIIGYRSKEER